MTPLEQMQALAQEHGGRCLSTEYTNSQTKLAWHCAKGHVYNLSPNSVKNTSCWCKICLKEKKHRLYFEEVT